MTAALKAHIARENQSTAMLWKVVRKDGTILRFTNHVEDITFGGGTFLAASGFSRSDIATAAALEVDTGEAQGFLQSPAITEDDLRAGLWDFAAIRISKVNYNDLTQGEIVYRVGTIGEVTVDRGIFKAEWRGLTQKYRRTRGQLTSPSCRAVLGDARCKVDLTPFTVTSTLTGVGPDNRTLYDTARTEDGPTGGVGITNITQADPGVVTLDAPLNLPSGSPITIHGVAGMVEVNTTTVALNVATDGLSFELPVDTTGFGAYVASTDGGTVTPLGSDSGYFDNGVITFTSGLNDGLSMEVQSYAPGQIILELPMPNQCVIGDMYEMHAGCDYSFATCRDRFNNVLNFRGEPYVPGVDKLVQVGKQ